MDTKGAYRVSWSVGEQWDCGIVLTCLLSDTKTMHTCKCKIATDLFLLKKANENL